LHNAGYRGLYNGLDEGGIHRLKKLTKNQKILDHMTAAEGAANLFRITQAKVAMRAQNPKTPQRAFDIARSAGVETREAMRRIGGVMPERMPVADSIVEAKRRLKANKPLLDEE
jgi:DNA-damage-inducible protein D